VKYWPELDEQQLKKNIFHLSRTGNNNNAPSGINV